jgi:hypothetical protein
MKLPKLHLRDLFWLVLGCALALGWLLDRGNLAAQNENLKVDLESEHLRGRSDEDARWFQVIENHAGLDNATKQRIRRDYFKLPDSSLLRP